MTPRNFLQVKAECEAVIETLQRRIGRARSSVVIPPIHHRPRGITMPKPENTIASAGVDLQPNWTDSGTLEELNKRYKLNLTEPGWIEESANTHLLIRVIERHDKEYYRLHCWNRTGVRDEFAAIANMKVLNRFDDESHEIAQPSNETTLPSL